MARGGARVRTGPPPSPNSLRSNPADWVHLPAEGRSGDPPRWPLPGRPNRREQQIWEQEWRRPQAIMWEKLGQELEVAIYVQAVVVADGVLAKSSDRLAVNRLMNDLGITVGGLAKNKWIIDVDTPEPTVRKAADDTRSRTARDRLKAIDGGRSA